MMRRKRSLSIIAALAVLPLASPFTVGTVQRGRGSTSGTARSVTTSTRSSTTLYSSIARTTTDITRPTDSTTQRSSSTWTSDFGDTTLRNVQGLASKVAAAGSGDSPNPPVPDERVWLALQSLEQDSE